MTVAKELEYFYQANNLDLNGGIDKDYFIMKFRFFSLKLPNSEFRKKIVHIHDIQHILFNCDVSWKGEAYIAGWEIATGMWKHFPIGFLSLWAMGFGVLTHQKEVLKGFKQGLSYNGLIDQNISKKEILTFTIQEVDEMLHKPKTVKFNLFTFLFWTVISVIIVIAPLFVVPTLLFLFL